MSGERIRVAVPTPSIDLDYVKTVAVNAVKSSSESNLLHWSAALAFYAALSFAPLLLVGLIGVSFFADADWAADRLASLLDNFLPDESEGRLREFVSNAVQSRRRVGLFSIAAFLFSGTRVFAALTRALHVIYHQEEERQFLRELGAQVVMLSTIGLLFLLALSSRYFLRLLSDAVAFLPIGQEQAAERLISGAIQIALLFGVFALIYRFIPSTEEGWRAPLIGASVATTLFVIVRPLFIFYLERFGNQEVVYGSLASLIILLIWIWIGAIVTLFGGAVASCARRDAPHEPGAKAAG